MLQNTRRNFQGIELLFRNLSRVRAHNEMHLVRCAIDLLKQTLQIDRSACTSRRDYEFHSSSVIPSGAEGEVEKSLDLPNISQRSSISLDIIEKDPISLTLGFSPVLAAARAMKPFQRLCPECEFKKAVETAIQSDFLSIRLKPGVNEKFQFIYWK